LVEPKSGSTLANLHARYQKLSVGKKAILIVFLIWLAQALPKWTAAIGADDEMSADIMRIFITPRSDYERPLEIACRPPSDYERPLEIACRPPADLRNC
jgi:hypothetical protein